MLVTADAWWHRVDNQATIIGGVLGVLLAPHRGDITRRKVARKAEEAKGQVIEVVENQVESLKVQKEEQNGDQETDI